MIIDVHAHLGRWPHAIPHQSAADLVAMMRRYDIRRTLVSSSLAIYYDFVEGNRTLAEEIRPYPELLAYVTVNLNYPEQSLAEIDRYLGAGRGAGGGGGSQFVGIKVHQEASRHAFNTPEGMAIAAAAARLRAPSGGVPILVHTFSSAVESPWNVVPAAKANPTVPIILGHMGGEAWWEGIRAASESDNLHLEICGTYTDPVKIRAGIAAVGAGRILFGSDTTLFDPAHMLGAVTDAGLTPGERELLMGENTRRMFKLSQEEVA